MNWGKISMLWWYHPCDFSGQYWSFHYAILSDGILVSHFQWIRHSLSDILRLHSFLYRNQSRIGPGSQRPCCWPLAERGLTHLPWTCRICQSARPVVPSKSPSAADQDLASHGLSQLEGPLETRAPSCHLQRQRNKAAIHAGGTSSQPSMLVEQAAVCFRLL